MGKFFAILLGDPDPRAQAHTTGKRRSVRMWDLVIFVYAHLNLYSNKYSK
jgi:hypothetical protein